VSISRRQAAEQRRHNWRLVLIAIIVITIPFYCVGFVLWGTASPKVTPTPAGQGTVIPTIPPSTAAPSPSATPQGFVISITPLVTLPGTEIFPSFVAPTQVFPTAYLSPTPPLPPTIPPLPTSAPLPTQPPFPTAPSITNTPLPFDP
jgi:hypothetical protein